MSGNRLVVCFGACSRVGVVYQHGLSLVGLISISLVDGDIIFVAVCASGGDFSQSLTRQEGRQ